MLFRDRADAGRRLAQRLELLRKRSVIVLGLPRGGVPVAAKVAEAFNAPLDVLVVRKLGLPGHPELAMGAIGEGGVRVLNDEVVHTARVTAAEIDRVEQAELVELARRVRQFRGDRRRMPITGHTAVVVDDGIATGATARAACQVARALGAARVVLAAPVASAASSRELRSVADDVVCVETPADFHSVGQFYADFRPTTDDEVVLLLTGDAGRRGARGQP